MKNRFNKYLLSFGLILICATVYAQKGGDVPVPGGNANENGHGPGGGHPGLPIDGGLSYLIIAGIAFGAYELKRKK